MADEASSPIRQDDPAELAARAADARLVRGVRWRLVLWSGGATLFVLLLLGVALFTAVANQLDETGSGQLKTRTDLALQSGRPGPGSSLFELLFGGGASGTFGFLIDDSGDVVGHPQRFDPPAGLPDTGSADAARASRDIDLRKVTTSDGGRWRVRSQAAVDRATGDRYVLQVVQDRSAEQRTLDVLLFVLVMGGVAAVLVATAVGAIYAQRALVPIRASLGAQRGALQRQREFAADASHELRTPLTIVRASVEHLRLHPERQVAEVGTALVDIDAEIGHLGSLVEDLLLLARSDSGALDLTLQPIELGDVAAEAASAMTAPAADRGVRVEVDPEPVIVVGDSLRLRQLITILVDNAVRHSPSGSTVGVRVRRDGDGAVLVVDDQGPGIKPDDLPHVFDRFWRAAGAPGGGTGLGLAIAATIVTRLGGRIGVANRPGGGAAFTVVLPLPQRPPKAG
jgi:signal transduction histidine kinase